jgi:hypothetical protein
LEENEEKYMQTVAWHEEEVGHLLCLNYPVLRELRDAVFCLAKCEVGRAATEAEELAKRRIRCWHKYY